MKHFPSVIRAFNQSKGGRFAWLYGHESMKTGEITDRQIQVGFSYLDLLGRAIEAASTIDAATVVANCPDCDDIETATKVLTKVRASYANRKANPKESPYEKVDAAGNLLFHKEAKAFYLKGLQVRRRVVEPGVHKPVQSRKETLVKRWIERHCDRITDYRTFKLTNNFDSFVFNGKIYRPPVFMSE